MSEQEKTPVQVDLQSRGHWTSASYAEADKLCPGGHLLRLSVPEPEQSEDAARGSRIHHAWATGKDDGLTLEEANTVSEFRKIEAEVISRYFGVDMSKTSATPMIEKRLWIQNAAGIRHSGQIDRAYRKGTKALILDGKSGRLEVPVSPRNLQLRDEVVLLFKNQPLLSEIGVAIVQPLVTHTPEITVYTPADIAVASAEMEARIAASNDSKSPRIAGEIQCNFCRAKTVCAEYSAWSSSLLPLPVEADAIERLRKPLAEWSGEDFALFKAAESVVTEWIKERHEMAVTYAEAGGVIPGYRLKPGNEVDKITKPQAVFERFAARGGTPEQYLSVVSVPKGKLKELFAVVVGLRGKALDAKFGALLEGCVESKQNRPSLVKE